jgi:hypothetical protein
MWMATRTGQVEDTQTLQLHTRADRPLALLRQGLRIHSSSKAGVAGQILRHGDSPALRRATRTCEMR